VTVGKTREDEGRGGKKRGQETTARALAAEALMRAGDGGTCMIAPESEGK